MRQKRKIKIKLIIFGIVFMLFGCSEDLYENENSFNNQGIKISKVSLKEPKFQNKTKLIQLVNKIKDKQKNFSVTGKIVYDSINNFYFDDENGMLIETSSGYESYTFKVERVVPNNYELENIVFSKNENDYDVSLVKYELTPTEQQKLESNISFIPAVEPNIEALNRVMACNTRIDKCVAGIDENGNYFFIITYLDPCTGSSGGGGTGGGTGSGSSGSNSGSGTGGTSGSGTGTGSGTSGSGSSTGGSWQGGGSDTSGGLLTTPTGGGGGTGAVANPCKKIKKQLDKFSSLKPALVTLKGTTSQNHENGIFIDNTATATTTNPIQNLPATTAQGAAVGLPNLPTPNKYTIIAHTHDAVGPNNTGTNSIFSWGDLSAIAEKIRLGQIDTDNFVFYVITADNTIYALTIDWPSIFSEYFDVSYVPDNPTLNFNSAKYAKLVQTSETYYKDDASVGSGKIGLATNSNDDLKIFLQMLKDTKLDVSLFEVDPTFTTYTKKTLSNNGTVTSGTPCN